MRNRFALGFIAMCLAGCIVDGEGDDISELDLEEEAQAGTTSNGTSVNGTSINGTSVNGTSINGINVSGGQLKGVSSTGSQLSGTQLVGAKLNATTDTGASVQLRIDSATAVKTDQWAYGVSFQDGAAWKPLCGDATTLAYAINGKWDYRSGVAGAGGPVADATAFTWSCRTLGAIAKCIDLGYAPWRTVSGTLLKDHHTACVRMLRGDYCGNGMAYTLTGTTINIYDNKGIQTDTQSWPLDAEWKATGARCIRKTRSFGTSQPTCAAALQGVATCGTLTNSLMIDEFQGS